MGGGTEDLGAGDKYSFASNVTKTVETKSPKDSPYHFWVMASLLLVTSILVTVGNIVTILATLLSSLLLTVSLLAPVYLLAPHMR